jgi:virginiamycin B lyase
MRAIFSGLALSTSMLALMTAAQAATIAGTVKGPDGAAFRGAFVTAQNISTKISTNVLSQGDGHYTIKNLPAGEYEISVKSVGFANDDKSRMTLAADQLGAKDFGLKKGMVQWADLSSWQGKVLFPDAPGKAPLFNVCFACHGFESRMADKGYDLAGWQSRVKLMTTSMYFFTHGRISEQDEKDVATYMNSLFGKDSTLPKSPEDMPKYKETVHAPFSDEALKIVYVEYEMPNPSSFPWAAAEDKNGDYWIPFYGAANRIARLNATTGKVEEFLTPNEGTSAIHSAIPAPDGSVWFTQQASNKIGRWDPVTKQITEYQDAWKPGKEGFLDGGSKHTLRVLPNGEVWATGGPLSKFDPKENKFVGVDAVPSVYGIASDKNGMVWFAEYTPNGGIGVADPKTMQVEKFMPPTKGSRSRRIVTDDKGVVWFAEFQSGKVGKFDPKTRSFEEWQLPGAEPTPYAFEVDATGAVWYSSEHQDVLGRLDPASGKVVEFPYVHAENTMREFFKDSKGRMWYGTPANNKVGYFYLDE